MKAVALTGVGQMEMIEMPAPSIREDTDVLLRVEMVGICGSDVHFYETGKIGTEVVKYPLVIGHECAATVAAVGSKVAGVKVGDLVAVEPAVICHKCDQCKKGRENTCRNLKFLGCPGQLSGGLCEYIVMPEECCFAVGDRMSIAEAVLCEPLAIAIYAIRQARLEKGYDIGILGAGPIGLSCMVSAACEKVASCYVTERVAGRLEAARTNGATWVGNPDEEDVVKKILKQQPLGLDVVFECAGKQETIDQSVDLLKPGGKLMLIGIPRKEKISFVIDKIRRKEITIINVRRQNRCTQPAVDAVASGAMKVDFMATHFFSLSQAKEAFDTVAEYRDGVVKALIEPQKL